jgi:hypothetical protein
MHAAGPVDILTATCTNLDAQGLWIIRARHRPEPDADAIPSVDGDYGQRAVRQF